MSATLRAFYGALVGALLVLLIHPYSRPYLLQGMWFADDSPFLRQTGMLAENLSTLPEPDSLEDAGLWVEAACNREFTGKDLTEDELLLVTEVVQAAAAEDPDNAFWRQAEAVFLWQLGNQEAALEAWATASVASRWNDMQNSRLNGVLDGLRRESGRNLGWHYALVDSRKTSVTASTILSFSRQTLRGERARDLELRLATLRNGRLMRDGSRSVNGATMGFEAIELAAYATAANRLGYSGLGGPITPRALTTARDDLLTAVREVRPEVEDEVKAAFRENDARAAFISFDAVLEDKRVLNLTAVLAATLPGALVTIGVIGAAIYLLGWAITRAKPIQRALTPPWTFVLGAVAGLVVFLATNLVFPSLWAAVSLASFGVRRDNERQAAPGGLGTVYGATLAILAVGFSLVMALYFISVSLPGEYVLEAAGISSGPLLNEFALVSVAGVVASLALVTASVWGFLSRVPAERLAGPSVARFGASVCLGSFAAGIVLVPIAIWVDRSVGDTLSKIYQNEPTYYLTQ